MKKIKNFLFTFIALCLVCSFMTSCEKAAPDATEEAVLVYKPWFFGHGGIDMEAITTGLTWCAPTTHVEYFKTVPVKYCVNMQDLVSDDNTPLDFHTIIITQLKPGKSPVLLQNYGADSIWFNTNLYNYYCNLIRDHVSQHNPFELMSNRQVLNKIDSAVLSSMQMRIAELSKDKEFPIVIKQVTIGKAIPNQKQKDEMDRTAEAVQAKQTQLRAKEMQDARETAEIARAKADKAYMREMNLSTQDFINLEWIKTISKMPSANVNVMVGGGANPQWHLNKK